MTIFPSGAVPTEVAAKLLWLSKKATEEFQAQIEERSQAERSGDRKRADVAATRLVAMLAPNPDKFVAEIVGGPGGYVVVDERFF